MKPTNFCTYLIEGGQEIEKIFRNFFRIVLCHLSLLCDGNLCLNLTQWLNLEDKLELSELVNIWIEGPASVKDITGSLVSYRSNEDHATVFGWSRVRQSSSLCAVG